MFVALSLLAQFIPQMQFSDGNFWENLLRSELEICYKLSKYYCKIFDKRLLSTLIKNLYQKV